MNRQFGRRMDPFNYENSKYERLRFNAMLEAIKPFNLGKVLEAGCAEGHFTEILARCSQEVTALDISSVALERVRKRVPRAQFIKADLLVWAPAREDRYDLIVLSDVLNYLERPVVQLEFESLFDRMASWLTDGGHILLVDGFGDVLTLNRRKRFRVRFQEAGLKLISERIVPENATIGLRCLLSVFER